MMPVTKGLHHITALAIDPQANIDFYTQVLGLSLVKNTVNFDAPDVYHFYYGDADGHPGTIMTFFPFVYAGKGRAGAGVTETTAFAAPKDSLDAWMVRLAEHGVDASAPFERFGAPAISLADPDGLKLEIVCSGEGPEGAAAITGFHSAALKVAHADRTVKVLTDVLGYGETAAADGVRRFSTRTDAVGRHIDVIAAPDAPRVQPGGGTVHHIAFRAADRTELGEWRKEIAGLGFNVTPIIDRNYFESIYFREPGGVLFEIATDPPGFAADEPAGALGRSLKLPPQYEERRAEIERRLPPVVLPHERAGS